MFKKYLITALSFMFLIGTTSIPLADYRMENNQDTKFTHFVFDDNDTDNEYFSPTEPGITVIDGVASGYAHEVIRGAAKIKALIPEGGQIMGGGKRGFIFTSEDSDNTCTMVETNGTAYVSNDWESEIIVHNKNKATLTLTCRNGVEEN